VRSLLGLVLAAGLVVGGVAPAHAERITYDEPTSTSTSTSPSGGGSLSGRTIVIDPGHQLGNYRFPSKIHRLVPAGGFKKPCNTTGTSTNGGYAEATFTWHVSLLLRDRLEHRGARVILTRSSNSLAKWGPCVDKRGRAGNQVGADLKISIHGDGNYTGGPGFHVIVPPDRKHWTHDIYQPSLALAKVVRARLRSVGLHVAHYIAGGDGLDIRSDLGTLNLSDVPTVMVELGNMRAPADAHRMTTHKGQARYARALTAATYRFLK
jgi:N-acetylmuramoyl-L-alanine amidase